MPARRRGRHRPFVRGGLSGKTFSQGGTNCSAASGAGARRGNRSGERRRRNETVPVNSGRALEFPNIVRLLASTNCLATVYRHKGPTCTFVFQRIFVYLSSEKGGASVGAAEIIPNEPDTVNTVVGIFSEYILAFLFVRIRALSFS